MVEIKTAFNDKTYELYVNGYLLIQRPKLEQIFNIANNLVEKYGYTLVTDII